MLLSDYLPLTHGHTMYYETHGTQSGKPVVILHGGPGGGMVHALLKHFNHKKWHIVMFDQRGCGKSTPYGLESLKHNTTNDLVSDIERLRNHLKIPQWFVFGGSWGTTLGIVYAETHPEKVTGLLLRSVCLIKPCEQTWLYGGGAGQIYPKEWQKFISIIEPPHTAKHITAEYRKLLTDPNKQVRQHAAKLWSDWEEAVSFLTPRPPSKAMEKIEAVSILENHYFYHNAWLTPNQLIKNAYRLANIPITIVHGRYDVVCPINASYEFKQAAPHAKFITVPDAGHASSEPGTKKALRKAINGFTRKNKSKK